MKARRTIRMQARLAVVASLVLPGCFQVSIEELGGRAAQTGNPDSGDSKSIYSQWSASSGAGPALDLQNYRAPATQKIRFDLDNGAACECVTGSTSGGSGLQLTQCKNAAGTSGENGCATLADQYTLIQNGGVLDVCDSKGACNQFK